VKDAPEGDGRLGPPGGAAPTGQAWKPVSSDLACGRSGVRWVLVDEVCGDGDGGDPHALETPMFRDGALVGSHLMTVDGTHLWSLDVTGSGAPERIRRSALVTGVGQALAVAAQGSSLYVAAGIDGLVRVDASDPAAPTRSASLALAQPAFDVDLRDARAYVATGKGGVAFVDVAGPAPQLLSSHVAPGYAAGVASDASRVYVAGCTAFSILDRTTGAVLGSVPFPRVGDRLLAPAKDVALVGDVAFVAAGKQGAVAIDVSTPSLPKVLGACSVDDPAFYASGVRAEAGAVFVAAGEWGVLRIDATNPATACPKPLASLPPAPPPGDCSQVAPWEAVPWEEVWAPPPPAKDPIQVLPAGDRVYAFGDARRIGVRAVDVRAATDLARLGRYDEPRMLLGVAVRGQRLVALGPRGGVFDLDAAGIPSRSTTATAGSEDALLVGEQVVFLGDGHFAVLRGGSVTIEGLSGAFASGVRALAAGGNELAVVTTSKVDLYTSSGIRRATGGFGSVAHLPPAVAATDAAVYVAAPEWLAAEKHAVSDAELVWTEPRHNAFDDDGIMDTGAWLERVPRRHLAGRSDGFLELAAVGRSAGLAIHGATGTPGTPTPLVALPPLTYVGLTSDAEHAYAIGIDRGLYRSYLVTISLVGTPRVTSFEVFTGAASGIAASGGKVYVTDADGAIRVYAASGATVVPVATVRVEERP